MKCKPNLKDTIIYLSDLIEKTVEETLDLSDFGDLTSQHLHLDKKGEKIYAFREIAHEKMAEKIRSGLNATETEILTELLKKIVTI